MEITTPIRHILEQKGTQVWTIAADATVYEAIALMAEKNIGALAVMDADRLVGTLSERDYTRKVILLGRASRETPVADIMTSDVAQVGPLDSVQHCMALMTKKRRRHLIVIKDGSLAGIISIGDVVNWIMGEQQVVIEDLESLLTGSYPR